MARRTTSPGPSLEQHLEGGELAPVYTVISSEPIITSDAVALLRSKALTAAPDFNRDEFRAGETAIGRVLDAAGTMPMMAPRRWVHLSDIHKLKAKDAEPLLAYIEAPCPTTVLCVSGQKLDLRLKLGKTLSKQSAYFPLDPPKQHEMARWLRARATARGYNIAPDAAGLLADLLGTDVGAVDRALDKLWIYRGAQGTIELEDVEATVAPTRVHSIFELADAIGARDLPKASLLLRNAIDSGEAALRVLSMISRQFRLLLKVKALGGAAGGPNAAKELGVAPFLVRGLVQQARRYQTPELWRAINAAARADERLKSTRLNHGVVLDRLLVEAMGSARRAS